MSTTSAGSGVLFLAPEIWQAWRGPVLGCNAPCTFVFPPRTLLTPTTFIPEPMTISTSVPGRQKPFVTTWQPPPVTTSRLNYWNVQVTIPEEVLIQLYCLVPSVRPSPTSFCTAAARVWGLPCEQLTVTPPPYPYTATCDQMATLLSLAATSTTASEVVLGFPTLAVPSPTVSIETTLTKEPQSSETGLGASRSKSSPVTPNLTSSASTNGTTFFPFPMFWITKGSPPLACTTSCGTQCTKDCGPMPAVVWPTPIDATRPFDTHIPSTTPAHATSTKTDPFLFPLAFPKPWKLPTLPKLQPTKPENPIAPGMTPSKNKPLAPMPTPSIIPKVPSLVIPKLPEFNIPKLPSLNIPKLPGVDIPKLPGLIMPKLPGLDLPKLPGLDLPRIPKLPKPPLLPYQSPVPDDEGREPGPKDDEPKSDRGKPEPPMEEVNPGSRKPDHTIGPIITPTIIPDYMRTTEPRKSRPTAKVTTPIPITSPATATSSKSKDCEETTITQCTTTTRCDKPPLKTMFPRNIMRRQVGAEAARCSIDKSCSTELRTDCPVAEDSSKIEIERKVYPKNLDADLDHLITFLTVVIGLKGPIRKLETKYMRFWVVASISDVDRQRALDMPYSPISAIDKECATCCDKRSVRETLTPSGDRVKYQANYSRILSDVETAKNPLSSWHDKRELRWIDSRQRWPHLLMINEDRGTRQPPATYHFPQDDTMRTVQVYLNEFGWAQDHQELDSLEVEILSDAGLVPSRSEDLAKQGTPMEDLVNHGIAMASLIAGRTRGVNPSLKKLTVALSRHETCDFPLVWGKIYDHLQDRMEKDTRGALVTPVIINHSQGLNIDSEYIESTASLDTYHAAISRVSNFNGRILIVVAAGNRGKPQTVKEDLRGYLEAWSPEYNGAQREAMKRQSWYKRVWHDAGGQQRARIKNVLVIGGVDPNRVLTYGTKASFSQGPNSDIENLIYAPATADVARKWKNVGTSEAPQYQASSDYYVPFDGTSASAALTTGMISNLWALPEFSTLTAGQMANKIVNDAWIRTNVNDAVLKNLKTICNRARTAGQVDPFQGPDPGACANLPPGGDVSDELPGYIGRKSRRQATGRCQLPPKAAESLGPAISGTRLQLTEAGSPVRSPIAGQATSAIAISWVQALPSSRFSSGIGTTSLSGTVVSPMASPKGSSSDTTATYTFPHVDTERPSSSSTSFFMALYSPSSLQKPTEGSAPTFPMDRPPSASSHSTSTKTFSRLSNPLYSSFTTQPPVRSTTIPFPAPRSTTTVTTSSWIPPLQYVPVPSISRPAKPRTVRTEPIPNAYPSYTYVSALPPTIGPPRSSTTRLQRPPAIGFPQPSSSGSQTELMIKPGKPSSLGNTQSPLVEPEKTRSPALARPTTPSAVDSPPFQGDMPPNTDKGGSQSQQIAIASYIPPKEGPELWDRLFNYVNDKVSLLVANVNNGPDAFVNKDWADIISESHAKGKRIIGYVRTGYLGKSQQQFKTRLGYTDMNDWAAQIEMDVDLWFSLYPGKIGGIFFDEGWNDCGPNNVNAELYRFINENTKRKYPGAFTVLNPGDHMPQCFEHSADTLLTFESTFSYYLSNFTENGWSSSDNRKIWHIVHTTSSDQIPEALRLSKERGAGLIEITNGVMLNPYNTLPDDGYMQKIIGSIGGGMLAVAPVSAVSGGGEPPPPPRLLLTQTDYSSATLAWSDYDITATAAIIVYLNGVEVARVLPHMQYLDQIMIGNLASGTKGAKFWVTLQGGNGRESKPSNTVMADVMSLPNGKPILRREILSEGTGLRYSADVLLPYAFVRLFILPRDQNVHKGWPIQYDDLSHAVRAQYMVEDMTLYEFTGRENADGTWPFKWRNITAKQSMKVDVEGYTWTWHVPLPASPDTQDFLIQGDGYNSMINAIMPCPKDWKEDNHWPTVYCKDFDEPPATIRPPPDIPLDAPPNPTSEQSPSPAPSQPSPTVSPTIDYTKLNYKCRKDKHCDALDVKLCDCAVGKIDVNGFYRINGPGTLRCYAGSRKPGEEGCQIRFKKMGKKKKSCEISSGLNIRDAYAALRDIGGCGTCGTITDLDGCSMSVEYIRPDSDALEKPMFGNVVNHR